MSLKTELCYEIEVKDKNGKVLTKRREKAHSWLRPFIQLLKGQFATRYGTITGIENTSVVNESGTSVTYPPNNNNGTNNFFFLFSILGDAGDVSQGIIVGSGSTPNTITTFCLAQKITHGTGADQLQYQVMAVDEVTNPEGNILQFEITRMFINGSENTVTVREIGILVKTYGGTRTPQSFLVARDVLASPVNVPSGSTLTVKYIVKITIS